MFFDTLAVLVITFFAAIGMVEATEWLLKNPFRKKVRHKIFVVAKADSVSEEELEPALRFVLAETAGMKREEIGRSTRLNSSHHQVSRMPSSA